MKKIAIIIPVYNEEKRIFSTLRKISDFFSKNKIAYQIIIVDDGSKDNTLEKLRNLTDKNIKILKNAKNFGKGFSVKKGVLAATTENILITDADLSTPIEEINKLWPYLKNFPVIIGSRYLNSASIKVRQPLYRRIVSRVGNFLVRMILGLNFYDTQCGFKLFHGKIAKSLFNKLTIARWGFDIEILAIAKHHKILVKEIAVDWHDSPNSKLRAGRAAWQTLWELFKIRRNLKNNLY